LSLQFTNTSFDRLAFDSRERVEHMIRPALLKTLSLAAELAGTVKIATTDLAHFINVACKIWSKITSWARDANSRDRDETLVRLETVSRPRPHPYTAMNDADKGSDLDRDKGKH